MSAACVQPIAQEQRTRSVSECQRHYDRSAQLPAESTPTPARSPTLDPSTTQQRGRSVSTVNVEPGEAGREGEVISLTPFATQ